MFKSSKKFHNPFASDKRLDHIFEEAGVVYLRGSLEYLQTKLAYKKELKKNGNFIFSN